MRYDDTLQQFKKSKPKSIPEGVIVNQCIRALFTLGCFCWRNNTGQWKDDSGNVIRYGKVGSADIIGLTRSGKFIAVECKSGKNKQTDNQIHFQHQIEDKNGLYILAYSTQDIVNRQSEIMGTI